MIYKHYVQQIDFFFSSVQKSYFWLKPTLPKKRAKTWKLREDSLNTLFLDTG